MKEKQNAIKFLDYAIKQGTTTPVIIQGLAEMFADEFNKSVSPVGIKIPKKFKKVQENKWQQPVMKDYLMKCCDCGLVHEMEFRIAYGKTKADDRIQLRGRRISETK